MACVDENVIAAYFDFKLSSKETHRLFDHLDACVDCTRLLGASTVSLAMRSGTATSGGATGATGGDLHPPAITLGRYHIERVVGIGGMGVVYAGHDPELDRKVAIKLLLPDAHVDPDILRSRLKREAQAMARLSHPNVISVYDVGSSGDQVFIVMELVDGSTLGEWLHAGARSWREVLGVFLAAGAGLDAAHRAGIIHRDFKPDNVLVSRTRRICVTDFGLAHRIEDAGDPRQAIPPLAPQVTAAVPNGLLIGTPAYMAPEQIRGEPTDHRTDLFSFCVALYEALYGTRPFAGDNLDDLLAAIETSRLEPPRRRAPCWMRRTIEHGLRPRAADRPASMTALLASLEGVRRASWRGHRSPALRPRALTARLA